MYRMLYRWAKERSQEPS